QDEQLTVRLASIPLQIAAIGARENIPIDVPQIVTLRVSPILRELLAKSKIRRPMQPRDEAVDHSLSNEVKRRNSREGSRIQKSLQHLFTVIYCGADDRFLSSALRPALDHNHSSSASTNPAATGFRST